MENNRKLQQIASLRKPSEEHYITAFFTFGLVKCWYLCKVHNQNYWVHHRNIITPAAILLLSPNMMSKQLNILSRFSGANIANVSNPMSLAIVLPPSFLPPILTSTVPTHLIFPQLSLRDTQRWAKRSGVHSRAVWHLGPGGNGPRRPCTILLQIIHVLDALVALGGEATETGSGFARFVKLETRDPGVMWKRVRGQRLGVNHPHL